MSRIARTLTALGMTLCLLAGSASADPVIDFIVAADSVRTAAGDQGLAAWLPEQPDLCGAAVAQLIDIAVQVGDAGNADGEAENIVLVEALAEAHAGSNPDSAMPGLLAEYRSWDADARAARREANELEEHANEVRGAGDPDAAIPLFEQADEIYARIGDSHSRAVLYGQIGVTHWHRGDFAAVEIAYTEALRRRLEVQDQYYAGKTLNGLGSMNLVTGNLDAAIEWYAQAVELRRATGDRSGLGTSLTYEANVRVRLGQVVRARALYEQALPVLQEVGTPTQIVENLAGTAGLYQQMGRPVDAIRLYSDAINLCLDSEDCLHVPVLLVELADVQQSTGQLRECLSSLQHAEDLLETAPDTATATRLYQVWAVTSSKLGEQDAAREQMVRSLALARESGDAALQCDGLVLLSGLYLDLDAHDRARSSAEEALALANELDDPGLERAALVALANVNLTIGDGAAAAEQYSTALLIDESTGAQSRIAQDLVGRGGAYSLLGRDDEARNDLRRAAVMFREAGRESSRWVALLNIADSFEESAPDSAAWYYDAALTSLEHGNDAVGGEAMNTGYLFSDRGRAYEEITRYYFGKHSEDPDGGWDARAFETAERSRARGLLELFEESFALDAGPEALALIDSLYQIDTSTAEGRALRNRKQQELANLRTARQAQSDVSALGVDPVGLESVQGALPGNTLLLQYAVGDSLSLLWIVDSRHTKLVSLPGRTELRRRVRGFRDAIAQPGTADEILLRDGHALYQTLLAEAASQIDQREHLVIVPDDVLFELPFEALLSHETQAGATWSEQPFFGREHSPVYAPSSTVYLQLLERSGADFDRQLLALGDADYSGLDSAEPLEPLPFTRDEVSRIGSTLEDGQSVILVGPTATERALKTALHDGSSRVVHLATHGLIDPAEPMRSCVALGAGDDDDGYLYSLEILALPLENPMIVLSACESALGRLERGEGVVGLTRSFLGAGAQGVVASLWPVSDASTATLMGEFYDSMWLEQSAAVALRDARRTLLEDERWGHPYFWSAFVLIGTESMPW